MDTITTHDMVLTRTFDAPVEAVWRAWTEPELVKRWWGPTGFPHPWPRWTSARARRRWSACERRQSLAARISRETDEFSVRSSLSM